MTGVWIALALAAFMAGLSKGGFGAVLVTLITPVMAFVMPVQEAVPLVLPLLIFADVFALYAYWNAWDNRLVRLMLPAAFIGIFIGTFLLSTLDENTLRILLGLFSLGFVVFKLLESRLPKYQPKNWHGWLAGGASALTSALANSGAPPFTAYMLLQNVTPRVFIGTTTLFFAVVNSSRIPFLIGEDLISWGNVTRVIWVAPLVPLGVWFGRMFIDRVNKRVFDTLMTALLAVAGLLLLFYR